jgi:hypothetical protein
MLASHRLPDDVPASGVREGVEQAVYLVGTEIYNHSVVEFHDGAACATPFLKGIPGLTRPRVGYTESVRGERRDAPGLVVDRIGATSVAPASPSVLGRWWRSRFGAELAREIALVVVLLLLYRLGRQLTRDASTAAYNHARDVLALESRLHFGTEANLQAAILPHRGVVELLNQFYARVHFPATALFLAVLWWRAPDRYLPIRRLFALVTGMALVVHIAYPLAPPRMMPGFVDTIARFGPSIYQRSDVASMANQYAAMPSLHFGWAVLVAVGVIWGGRSRWRWAMAAYPAVTLLAIVATANHYWLDAAVALALIAIAVPICGLHEDSAADVGVADWEGEARVALAQQVESRDVGRVGASASGP